MEEERNGGERRRNNRGEVIFFNEVGKEMQKRVSFV